MEKFAFEFETFMAEWNIVIGWCSEWTNLFKWTADQSVGWMLVGCVG